MSVTPDLWLKRGKYFKYKDQYKIFYQEEGDGEVLLLLHGFPTSSWDWAKVWPELTRRYRCIAPDFIGFGFSDKPRDYAYSIIDQARLVEELLASLGILKVHILAHDYGDTVLQEMLARYQDRRDEGIVALEVDRVVLLNGGILQEMHRPRFIQSLLNSSIGFLLTPFLSRAMLAKNFREIFGIHTQPTAMEITHFYRLMEYNNGKRIFHKLIKYMTERQLYQKRWTDIFVNPIVSISLINGAADPISGIHVIERYEQLYGPVEKVILENIGHYPQHEAPELVLAALDEMLFSKT